MDHIDLLGYFAGILVVISLLPQVIKSWKTKMTRDISLLRYIIYVIGLILWVVYALIIENGPIAVMNIIGLGLASAVLYLKVRYK